MRPIPLARPAVAAFTLATGTAFAGPIGLPWYSIELSPWDAAFNVVPGQTVTLVSTTHAVGGEMAAGIPLGPYILPPAQADLSAVVINDGQTFWVNASTPLSRTLPNPPGTPIGGAATVDVVQSYRKNSADARLDFTYSYGMLELFRDIELGRTCDDCLHAEVVWEAEVYLTSNPGTVLWREEQQARLKDDNGVLSLGVLGFSNAPPVNPLWEWDCDRCGGPSTRLGQAFLDAPYTGIVDLSAIPYHAGLPIEAQPEFTVHYTLTAIAYDEGTYSGARAFARDPLGGNDSGVAFTMAGLTPSNNVVGAVPEPGTWALMLAGLGVVGWLASHRRRDDRRQPISSQGDFT